MKKNSKKTVIIIGAGFVGQGVVGKLSGNPSFDVILINNTPLIGYKPLYPDCSAGLLNPDVIAYPVERFCDKKKIACRIGEIDAIDCSQRRVSMKGESLTYDYLVFAPGVVTDFYGNDTYRKHVFTIDSYTACCLLNKELEKHCQNASPEVSVVIVGGGYTGIEFATHARKRLSKAGKKASITIIERAPDILGAMASVVKNKIAGHLQKKGINVMCKSIITEIGEKKVVLDSGVLSADIIVWTAGMCGTSLASCLGFAEKRGRIVVDETLRPAGCEHVFIGGDASVLYKMTVPIAKQYATQIVENIYALERGAVLNPFRPRDYGSIVALADYRGVGTISGISFDGLPGFLFHYMMCTLTLLGLRNKAALIKSLFQRGNK